jgi:trehalose 6-phosphate phosphatase
VSRRRGVWRDALVILRIVSPAAARIVEALEPLRSDSSHSAVLLDIDGTLAPIVRHAADAHVPEATRTLLIEIARRYRLVGCVSGRRAATARQIVAIGSIAYVGNHGGELLRAGATRPELAPELAAWTERVRAFATRAYTPEYQRLRVRSEDKHAIAAFHWRGAPDEVAAVAAVTEIAARAQEAGLAVHWGRKVLEVRPPVVLDKGLGVAALLNGGVVAEERGAPPAHEEGPPSPRDVSAGRGPAFHAALYVGDDTTDLDAFRGLRALVQAGELEHAVCAAVRSEEAPPELVGEADVAVDGPSGVRELLEALL